MAETDDYRTPDEQQATAEHDARVRRVLDQAVSDGVSCRLAILLGEPAEVVEHWTNAIWDGLRDGLSDDPGDHPSLIQEDRLCAIVLLLEGRMEEQARAILAAVAE